MIARFRAMLVPSPRGRRDLGRAGERSAGRFLRRAGFRILRRNFRTSIGEVDLLCLAPDRRTIVVVEVKTRVWREGDHARPPPEASITAHKRRKLLQLATVVSRQPRWANRPIRIDVVAIDWPDRGRPTIRHYPRAVTQSS